METNIFLWVLIKRIELQGEKGRALNNQKHFFAASFDSNFILCFLEFVHDSKLLVMFNNSTVFMLLIVIELMYSVYHEQACLAIREQWINLYGESNQFTAKTKITFPQKCFHEKLQNSLKI